MKILRVAQEIYPDVTGGGAYHAHAMSRDQAEMGHDVTVLSISSNISKMSKETYCGYTLIKFPANSSILNNEISIGLIKFLAKNYNEYDVLHLHAHFYFASNIAAVVSRFTDIPTVITNHAIISQSVPKWIAYFHLFTLGRFTYNSADAILCYTSEEKSRLKRITGHNGIHVISNGVEVDEFQICGEKSEHIDNSDSLSILFVGRFVDGKRPMDVIESFDDLYTSGIDAQLYLCGDGPLRDSLEQRVDQLNLNKRVNFLGILEYNEMPKLYRSADYLVLASQSEGFPRTVIEALSTGTPVITSNLDQIKDISNQAGETFEQGNLDQLTEKMKKLSQESVLSNLSGKSARKVVQKHSLTWEQTVIDTTNLMNDLL